MELVILPDEPLESLQYWLIEYSTHTNGFIHKGVLFTGFLKDGKPGNNSRIWNSGCSGIVTPYDMYYIKYISLIEGLDNVTKMPITYI